MKRVFVLAGALAALAAATPASAQVTVGWDVSGYSSYVWRGLTLSGKPVLQPDLYLTIPIGKASLTAGGWSSIELGKYDGTTIHEGNGTSSLDLTEFDWWGEISLPVGIATLTGGATGYIYPNPKNTPTSVTTSANNTVEAYGKIALSTPLSPKIAAYYDVDKIKGLYVEGSVSHGIPLGATTLTLGALAGWTGGQEVNTSKPSELANFSDKGLTHVDLSASVGFSAGPVTIAPSFHFVIAQDDFTKFGNGGKKHDTKIWGGATISWSKAFGAKEEEKK